MKALAARVSCLNVFVALELGMFDERSYCLLLPRSRPTVASTAAMHAHTFRLSRSETVLGCIAAGAIALRTSQSSVRWLLLLAQLLNLGKQSSSVAVEGSFLWCPAA